MKNEKTSGSLFGLLARNYLLFTLTLLVIAGCVFSLWSHWLGEIYEMTDWAALLHDEALAREDYEALTRRYLGGQDNAFAVYDENGTLLYASAEGFDRRCAPAALACVPLWTDTVETDVYEIPEQQTAGPRCLLIRRVYGAGDSVERVEALALDEEHQVLFGGFGDGRTAYTDQEFSYLSGRRFPDDRIFRAISTIGDGQPVTLLLREKIISDEAYYRRYDQSWRIWLLFIPLYLLSAGLFIWWLGRYIGQPLRRLNQAVGAQASGRLSRVGDCGGPREIRRIGESFDRFSDRLAESEAERRRLDEGRQKLIADISHDLKTPITVIAGYIDAICDGKVPPEETERYLKAIQAKAETLTELVNTFHEYSKVEHPQYVIHPRPTDLCEFSREYLAGKYDEIDLAGFSLEVSIPERALLCALDPGEFRRVLDNLISNALRHNRLGTILFFDITAEEGKAVMRVADNGTGIPPDRAKRIFEPFVVGSDARSGGGSGLGLAITRKIVEQHGGTIRLNPRPAAGRSTEFILELPLLRKKGPGKPPADI